MDRLFVITALAALIALGVLAGDLRGQPSLPAYDIIMEAGDPSPDGNGVFESTAAPVLSDSGKVAFYSNLVATDGGDADDWGIFLGDASELVVLAREGQMLPDGSSFAILLGDGDILAINALDQVAFAARLADPQTFPRFRGIFHASAAGVLKLARDDDPTPEGQGEFSSFGFPSLNEVGDVAFRGTVSSPGDLGTLGVYLWNGSVLAKVVRGGEAAGPGGEAVGGGGGIGPLSPTVNDAESVAFRATLDGISCILVWSSGALEAAACEQDPAPDGLGTIDFLAASVPLRSSVPQLSASGQVVFAAQVDDVVADYTGLFASQSGVLQEIARTGDTLGTGAILGTFGEIAQNDEGEVAFKGAMSDGQDALFFWDGSTVVLAAREGMPLADGGSLPRFFIEDPLAINDAGQIAFTAGTVAGSAVRGIWVWSPDGELAEALQRNQPFLGSTLEDFAFAARPDHAGDSELAVGSEYSGFNDSGEVAFSFVTDDGRTGIAKAFLVRPDALSDGLMILRYLQGYRGDALIGGAIDAGCSRCTADDVEDWIASVLVELDIDGNGTAAGLTDGLVIQRYLFGFRDATLVGDGVAGDCTRCDAGAIQQHIETHIAAFEIDGT